ncbi:MAG: RDD family protein [Acidobacteria bacterium]|nr:RDD family protein [Acidobacteriota bacterium]
MATKLDEPKDIKIKRETAGPQMVRVVRFEPEEVVTPFFLRFGAAAIDYLFLVLFPAMFLVISRMMGNDGAALINSELNNVGWLLSILFGLSNLIVLPILTGRTLGKFMTGLEIVGSDGRHPSIMKMLLRQTLGYLTVILSAGFGLLPVAFSRKGRALHDYIFGTFVVFASRKPVGQTND